MAYKQPDAMLNGGYPRKLADRQKRTYEKMMIREDQKIEFTLPAAGVMRPLENGFSNISEALMDSNKVIINSGAILPLGGSGGTENCYVGVTTRDAICGQKVTMLIKGEVYLELDPASAVSGISGMPAFYNPTTGYVTASSGAGVYHIGYFTDDGFAQNTGVGIGWGLCHAPVSLSPSRDWTYGDDQGTLFSFPAEQDVCSGVTDTRIKVLPEIITADGFTVTLALNTVVSDPSQVVTVVRANTFDTDDGGVTPELLDELRVPTANIRKVDEIGHLIEITYPSAGAYVLDYVVSTHDTGGSTLTCDCDSGAGISATGAVNITVSAADNIWLTPDGTDPTP